MRYLLLSLALVVTSSAALAAGNASQLLVPQWAAVNADGHIDVVIVAPGVQSDTQIVGEMSVSLVSQDGAVYRAEPSATSNVAYSFVGVPAGIYTVIARSPNLVACYAIHLVSDSVTNTHPPLEIAVAEMRVNKVRNAIIRYLPTSVPFVAEFDNNAGEKLTASYSSAQSLRVSQTAGGVSGGIYRAGLQGEQMIGAAMTNVLFYQNRELIAQAVTDENGAFSVETLAPGPYSVIAVGPDGIAVTGFQLVDELLAGKKLESGDQNANGETLVALQAANSQPSLTLQLSPSGVESQAVAELLQEGSPSQGDVADAGVPTDAASMQGSSGGVGGGGGGGGSGGIGGGGGLGLAIGAAVIGVAAFGSDDGDVFTTPPVTSPLTP